MSGVEVDPGVVAMYKDMKMRKTHKYALFRLTDDWTNIVNDEQGDYRRTSSKEEDKAAFGEFVSMLGDQQPRYALYDFRFTDKDGRIAEKLAFVFWCPDTASVKRKMIYATSKHSLKSQFPGLMIDLQVNDRGDLDYEALILKVEKHL